MTTLEQARRRALALGAELEVDGRRINAGRQRLAVVPKTAADAGPPPRDKTYVLYELMALQARITSEQTETLGKVLTEMAGRIERPPPKIVEVPAKRMLPIAIRVVRDASGKAVGLDPRYGEVAEGELVELRRVTDERGLLAEIVPEYADPPPQRRDQGLGAVA